jgi:hypothetical protein
VLTVVLCNPLREQKPLLKHSMNIPPEGNTFLPERKNVLVFLMLVASEFDLLVLSHASFLRWNLAQSTTICTSCARHASSQPAPEVSALCRVVPREFDRVMSRDYYWQSSTWLKLISSPEQCLPPFWIILSLVCSAWLVTKEALHFLPRPSWQVKGREGNRL